MPYAPTLQTKRLILRPWRDSDRDAFAAMNADARVMEHLMGALGREASETNARESMVRIQDHFDAHGFGWWAAEIPGVTPFAGFIGIARPTFETHFTPCVEIGWRLAVPYWGCGYATEGARAALTFAFESLGLSEIVSMTVLANVRSQHVMKKIGMTRSVNEDFEHPKVPVGHPLRPHVLYRLSRVSWREQSGQASVGLAAIDRARAFAAALDADDFERARPLLATQCHYAVRGTSLVGPDAILASYAEATRFAHALVDEVAYESRAVEDDAGLRILFTDVLRHRGREHRHQCVQRLTVNAEGCIERIVHEDLSGEKEALNAFLDACAIVRA